MIKGMHPCISGSLIKAFKYKGLGFLLSSKIISDVAVVGESVRLSVEMMSDHGTTIPRHFLPR